MRKLDILHRNHLREYEGLNGSVKLSKDIDGLINEQEICFLRKIAELEKKLELSKIDSGVEWNMEMMKLQSENYTLVNKNNELEKELIIAKTDKIVYHDTNGIIEITCLREMNERLGNDLDEAERKYNNLSEKHDELIKTFQTEINYLKHLYWSTGMYMLYPPESFAVMNKPMV